MHLADLMEAEGRSLRDAARTEGRNLRQHMANVSLAAALLLVAAPLAVVGACLLLGSLFLVLRGPMGGYAGPAAITGVVTLCVTGILLWLFKSLTK